MRLSEDQLLSIHQAFSSTDFGHILANRVRYEKYKPAETSNDRWIELLGPDVGNLSHLTATYELTKSFIDVAETTQSNLLDDNEKNTLCVAALIHDWAESIVGDISFGDKTELTDAEEKQHFKENLDTFYTGPKQITDAIYSAATDVIFDHASKLGMIFNAIERLGYMQTALRAHDHIAQNNAAECKNGFMWLVADVLSNQVATLLDYAKMYSPVDIFMDDNHSAITDAFTIIDDKVFENYEPAKQRQKRAEFKEGQKQWEAYLLSRA